MFEKDASEDLTRHRKERSIYLVLFVLQVAHKASTRARQRCRSAETRSRRPHVQPFSFISLSTVLLQVSLGRPLFLWPSGVHRRAILVKAVVCWRSTCRKERYSPIIIAVDLVSVKFVHFVWYFALLPALQHQCMQLREKNIFIFLKNFSRNTIFARRFPM